MYHFSKNKIKGILYGLAIGDALGATTEFLTPSEINQLYPMQNDIIGQGWLRLLPGEVTDPTESMFCVFDALEQTFSNTISESGLHNDFLNYCCKTITAWYDHHPVDMEDCCKKAVQTCRNSDYEAWISFSENQNICENSNLFRSIPLILTEQDTKLLLAQSRLTHNSTLCDSCLLDYRHLLLKCLNNQSLIIDTVTDDLSRHRHIKSTICHSIHHLITNDSFENAVLDAIHSGGDTNAIAALTGSLAGAKYGYDAIPNRWISQLQTVVADRLDYCMELLSKFT